MIMMADLDNKIVMAAYFRGKIDALHEVVIDLDEISPLETDFRVWQKVAQRIESKLHEAMRLSEKED